MNPISLPDDFDFNAAVEKAVREAMAPAVRLEMLKNKLLLTGKEVEELYGIPASSLKTWRHRGCGPKCKQYDKGSRVFYEHAEIKNFISGNSIEA